MLSRLAPKSQTYGWIKNTRSQDEIKNQTQTDSVKKTPADTSSKTSCAKSSEGHGPAVETDPGCHPPFISLALGIRDSRGGSLVIWTVEGAASVGNLRRGHSHRAGGSCESAGCFLA